MTQTLPPYTMISDADSLRWLAVELANEPLLAVDTESNSLHAYKERVCLVQLSTREHDYIIDPFEIEDMSPFGVLLADPKIEIILHAAEYDLMTLKRDYGFTVENLFDTLIAARIVGYESFGLAALLQEHFDVKPDKSHQRDNWGRRPLPPDSLAYAQMDTHYLPRLRDILIDELNEMGRLAEAKELFIEAQDVPAADNSTDYEGYWNLGRPKDLSRDQMAVLREVYLLREELAEEANSPTFKILSNQSLIEIARAKPTSLGALADVRSVGGGKVRRYGDDLLDAIERGLTGEHLPDEPPLPQPPDPVLADRYVVLQQWRKEKGIERGVGSDVVMAKDVLWDLARTLPETMDELADTAGIGPERLRLYGDDLLDVLAGIRVG
ncbi:MAG: ribonuclease D [Chloroflexota bacterium]